MRRALLSKSAWWCVCGLLLSCSLAVTAAPRKRNLNKLPPVDPQAETVDLFEAINQGLLEVKVLPHNADSGRVFIENKSDRPLTVKFPKAVAAVQVLKQGAGQRQANPFVNPGNVLPQIGQNGQGGQVVGGGIGVQNNNNGRNQGLPPMIFSVAPEQVARFTMKTVCLEHGKPDPRPSMTYQLVPLDQQTSDPVLVSLLEQFVAGNGDQKAVQAAAWHLANHMSWKDLAAKKQKHLGGIAPTPYFQESQLKQAQELVAKAQTSARGHNAESKSVAVTTARPDGSP